MAPARESGKDTFKVNGSGKREPVARPSTSVGKEVVGLRRAAGAVRECIMVRAVYLLAIGCTNIGIVEGWLDERCVSRS